MGLCEHLDTPVKIEYLDGQDFSGQLGSITLPDTGAEAMVTLLYRFGVNLIDTFSFILNTVCMRRTHPGTKIPFNVVQKYPVGDVIYLPPR